jgi:hypothetical protein
MEERKEVREDTRAVGTGTKTLCKRNKELNTQWVYELAALCQIGL